MSSEKNLSPLSAAQQEVMEIVWEMQEASVADVLTRLNRNRRKKLARNTVQTMMSRMEEKGWLDHRTVGRTFLYFGTQSKKASLGNAVRQLVQTAFDGSVEKLVNNLLVDQSLSKEEADRIRAMIDAAEQKSARKK